MSKAALLRLTISGLLLLACLVNHALPRMAIPHLRVVPIERLPRQVGTWTCVQDLPVETKVREILPDASFLSRLYQDERGRRVELFLETSQNANMFHSPTQCMPAQNWNIVRSQSMDLQAAAQENTQTNATQMQLQNAGQNLLMLYWYTSERQMDKWEALKSKTLSGRQPTRLFVRLLVPYFGDPGAAQATTQDMARQLLPAIAKLEKQGE